MPERRTLLGAIIAACTGGIAGCGGDSGDGGGDAGTTTREPDTPTPTVEQTTTAAEQTTTANNPAVFEVVSFDVPQSVEVNEGHTFSVTVENTGGSTGDFSAPLEFRTGSSSEWNELTTIDIRDLAPGGNETWTSEEYFFERAAEIHLRIADYNVQKSYRVVLPNPSIDLGDPSMVAVDLGYDTVPMAELTVTNTGELPIGLLPLTIDWYDGEDTYLASTQTFLQAMRGGEQWLPRVDPTFDVDNPDQIDSADASAGQAEITTALDPSGVNLVEDTLLASSEEVRVRGTVRNELNTEIDYLEVVLKVYNSVGQVIGSEWTNETDIASGEEFRFDEEILTEGRNGAVESHVIEIADEVLGF